MDPLKTPPTIPEVLGALMPTINQVLFGLGPVLLVGALVYAGYTRLMAADNPNKVKQANATIMWAVVGYVVVLVSFLIVRLVASTLGFTVGDTIDVTL